MRSGVYRQGERPSRDAAQSSAGDIRNASPPKAVATPRTTGLSEDKEFAPIAHILASETFRRAPRLKGLLTYLWECASAGRTSEVSEQQIGMAVFGRAVDYDCANDNIVRVTVRQLRLKLQEYYETEGAGERQRLLIPKGYYVPELVARHPDNHQAEEPHPLEVAKSGDAPRETTSGIAPRLLDSARSWRWLSLSLALLFAAFGVAVLLNPRSVRRVPVSQVEWQPSNNLVRALVLVPHQRTPIVVGDSSLELVEDITGRAISLPEYLNGDFSRNLVRSSTVRMDSVLGRLLQHRGVGVDEASAAAKIVQANPDQAGLFSIGAPNSIELQDLRTLNVILVGNPRSNPWMPFVSQSLNFQITSVNDSGEFGVDNRNPKTGEPARYRNEHSGDAETSYGLIEVTPNLGGSGTVLILSATSVNAMVSAAEFVCHPEAAQRTAGVLRLENLQQAVGLELVLKVESLQSIPRQSQIVASRVNLRTHA